ncbi:PEP-CTERM sorting domain-containing protein [Roseateles albus]|uniref:PEP-CTERM sorting domain-containing protein n=1 Tax=Roseateles albus TaxID=2987525 RepID=A0ABT5KKR0_9BURK|nr:PEP-CTERM sorting domain-containing protein [Roseateles albus]MDC8773505.1 PEP-CTERM sorting domain-containing protein [Roseateles albus]
MSYVVAFRRLVGAACFLTVLAAQAALPTVKLSFNQASGTVGPTDIVEVWMTLTVDAGSSPLVFDSTTAAPFGFAAGDLPAQGYYNDSATYGTDPADFATYTYVQTNTFYGCSGTFTASCGPGAYSFNFHTTDTPAAPSFNFLTALSLQPGQSKSYLFGTFTPNGGPVVEGTYTFYRTGATLLISGLDANGHDLSSYYTLGESCATETADCAFTRTVMAVPEPQSSVVMALGLLGIGCVLRRRRV